MKRQQDTAQAAMNYVEGANYTGLGVQRFLTFVRGGLIPARIPPGTKLPPQGRVPKSILFMRADLDAFLDKMPALKI